MLISTQSSVKIKNGNEEEFKKLYFCFADKLYNFALSYLKNAHEAEELVQNLFIKVWEKRAYIDPSKSLASLLYKMAINMVYDKMRKCTQLSYVSTDEELEHVCCSHNDVVEAIDYEDLEKRIMEIVAALPEQRRRIFELSRIDGLNYDEISQQLSLSRRTVENQIYRALQFIKQELQAEMAFDEMPSYLIFIIFMLGLQG